MSKFFVDSNIFIESLKKPFNQEAVKLIQLIFSDDKNDYFINETVFSEVYYQLIIKGKITSRQKENDLWEILDAFTFLSSNREIISNGLISLDTDFLDVATKENIKVINSSKDLETIIEEK